VSLPFAGGANGNVANIAASQEIAAADKHGADTGAMRAELKPAQNA